MIKDYLSKTFKSKKKNTTENNAIESEPKKKKGKFQQFLDNIFIILSFWFTILLFIYLHPRLPNPTWPMGLDRILLFLLLYLLVYFTINVLRPVVYIVLIIATFIFLSQQTWKALKRSSNQGGTTDIENSFVFTNIQRIFQSGKNGLNTQLRTKEVADSAKFARLQAEIDSLKMNSTKQPGAKRINK